MYKAYSGVGSRETPEDIMSLMALLAAKLEASGYILRSGAADGADSAFEQGVVNPQNKEIYIAWDGFSGRYSREVGVHNIQGAILHEAEEIAKNLHPAWDRLTQGAKKLHTRNVFQVLGAPLDEPSKFLVCWAPVDKNGEPKGGTRTSWMLAKEYNIPCFNLNIEEDKQRILKYIGE